MQKIILVSTINKQEMIQFNRHACFYEYRRRMTWEFLDLIATAQVWFLMLRFIDHVVWYFTDISELSTASAFTVVGLARQATRRVKTAKYQASWRLLLSGYLLGFDLEDGGGASETSVNFYRTIRRYMSAASVLDCGSYFCVISNNLKLSYITSNFVPVVRTH
jgi:hypothetical protein